jgi:hypothetical protein
VLGEIDGLGLRASVEKGLRAQRDCNGQDSRQLAHRCHSSRPNGSRLSCGRQARRAQCYLTIVRARQGTTTPIPLRAMGPPASSAC